MVLEVQTLLMLLHSSTGQAQSPAAQAPSPIGGLLLPLQTLLHLSSFLLFPQLQEITRSPIPKRHRREEQETGTGSARLQTRVVSA